MEAYFCPHCKTFFNDETAIKRCEDPSPRGITGLFEGYEIYLCCPNCGSDWYENVMCNEECSECKYSEYCEERI